MPSSRLVQVDVEVAVEVGVVVEVGVEVESYCSEEQPKTLFRLVGGW